MNADWKRSINLLRRRTFLGQATRGLGAIALASLMRTNSPAADVDSGDWRGAIERPHLPVRARRVIFLGMSGGMSHLETLDYKPRLAEMHGQPMPESFTKGQPIAQLQNAELRCLAPQHGFSRCGRSGQEISDVFPHIQSIADEICIVRSMTTNAINHDPAQTFLNTGSTISGRPCMGSWVLYGLGSQSNDLPGFIVLTSVGGGQGQPIASRQWHSGFLPSRFQGVQFHGQGDPVLYVGNPPGVTGHQQRRVIDTISNLNREFNSVIDDPEIATRISQYELAFRMQTSVPALNDLSSETQATLDMYGTQGSDGTYAANCLLARRLIERGVRFVQLYHRGWDHHGGVKNGVATTAKLVDQATAALIKDLKQRGLLDDTLVVCAGEFGRTPMAQGTGRDHHIKGYSIFLAGGGIRPGFHYGATDELGYYAVENVMTVHDLHATMLSLLGIDHLKLTVRFQGRDFRLTDVHGNVVDAIVA
jgi:hypothetical protein